MEMQLLLYSSYRRPHEVEDHLAKPVELHLPADPICFNLEMLDVSLSSSQRAAERGERERDAPAPCVFGWASVCACVFVGVCGRQIHIFWDCRFAPAYFAARFSMATRCCGLP